MLFLCRNNNDNVCTKRSDKGSMTLETAIALPIFISIILSVSLLLKIIYTYEIMQNAISLAANELSAYSYLYYLSGIEDIRDKLDGKIDEISGEILNEIFNEIFNDALNIQPPEELKDVLYSFIKGTYDDAINQICIPLVKICVRKYLVTDEIKDPNKRLEALDIAGGFDGLDFSMSEFFEDDNDTINIVIEYRINIPTPMKIFPPLRIIQNASVRGWVGGDEIIDRNEDEKVQEDIWSLDNFTRGRKIRNIFGANLPLTFPVIARFDHGSGTAVMIKSMDLTLEYYQKPEIVSKKIKQHINELKEYKGQEVPWGRDRIIIKQDNIMKRKLTLVIPENPITSVIEKELEECKFYAESNGVNLSIIKYGNKQGVSDEFDEEKEKSEVNE